MSATQTRTIGRRVVGKVRKAKLAKRTCRCGCEKRFQPRVRTQLYVNQTHKNRAAQARLRERGGVA